MGTGQRCSELLSTGLFGGTTDADDFGIYFRLNCNHAWCYELTLEQSLMQRISLYNFQRGSECRELVNKMSKAKGGSGRSLNSRCHSLMQRISLQNFQRRERSLLDLEQSFMQRISLYNFQRGSGCRELVNIISKGGAMAPTAPPAYVPERQTIKTEPILKTNKKDGMIDTQPTKKY